MLRRPELAVRRVDCNADSVPNTAGKVHGVRVLLIQLPCIPFPNAGSRFEVHARLFSRRILDAILLLTGVGRRADVDVERSVAPDRKVLVLVTACRKSLDDGVGAARRLERTRLVREAQDAAQILGVEMSVEHRDFRRIESTGELHSFVGLAVAVGVAKRQYATAVVCRLL